MKKVLVPWIALMSLAMAAAGQEPKSVELHSHDMRAKVYLPSADHAFYTGTRFDRGGTVADLRFDGHHLYQPWFNAVDPSIRDFSYNATGITASQNSAMVGPAEEFQKPIGYETAKAGDTFLKVGVGLLRKGDDAAYFFGKHFDVVDAGTWSTKVSANTVSSTQVLGRAGDEYAYVYTKTFRLAENAKQLVIEHRLKNVGKATIDTPVYDHNFLDADNTPVGGYVVTTRYNIKAARAPDPAFVSIEGKNAKYLKTLTGEDRVAFGLQGFGTDASDYDFLIRNEGAGFSVRMQGDRPLENAAVWSIRTVFAVEPFIHVVAEPGKETSWTYTYTYASLKAGTEAR